MSTALHFVTPQEALQDFATLVVTGLSQQLSAQTCTDLLPEAVRQVWPAMLASCKPGDTGASTSTWSGSPTQKYVAAVLPQACSRHNSPARPHAVQHLVSSNLGKGDVSVLILLSEARYATATGCAVARTLSDFGDKGKPAPARNVRVAFLSEDGGAIDLERIATTAQGVRLAAQLVDMPPNQLTTTEFANIATKKARAVGASVEIIRGKELQQQGMGGIWGVGQAAEEPPALVILRHAPADATLHHVWVGKGIVYDTGGLSIKGKMHMPGMKADMGGAAAILGAFLSAAQQNAPVRITALLCLAENAVGSRSFRPDDILHMYAGTTVEVNNTDAEGRLVLADGVAYATKHLAPDVLIDMATLTGAQLVSTGRRHAAIMCNEDALETRAIAAGKLSGDLVHPLPYCPEFFRAEFKSSVADLKNSVKDRMNAQSSCAGQFIGEHLVDYDGPWLHVDIAGPSTLKERGTGFGVALLLDIIAA